MIITKKHLVDAVYQSMDLDLTKKESTFAVEAILNTINKGLSEGKSVRLTDIFTINVRKRKTRRGFNPHYGTYMDIPESKGLRISIGKNLKKLLNR